MRNVPARPPVLVRAKGTGEVVPVVIVAAREEGWAWKRGVGRSRSRRTVAPWVTVTVPLPVP